MEVNHYEKAGIIFSQEQNSLMSYNLFLDALRIEKDNPMIWYSLGDSLIGFSNQTKSYNIIDKAIFCILKSCELDQNNPMFKNAIQTLKNNPDFGIDKINNCPKFTFEEIESTSQNIQAEHLIAFYKAIKTIDNKISLVIHLGETKDDKFFQLLKYCILNDDNQNVKFAGLKRIHFFNENNDVKCIYDKIIEEKKRETCEPYFSMSLSRINEDWSKELIKDSKIDFNEYDETINQLKQKFEKENEKDIEDEMNAMIYVSLSRFKLSEMKKHFENKNNRLLVLFLTADMMQSGIDLFNKTNIINPINNEITEFGWERINFYLEKQTEITSKNIVEKEIETSERKWWEFWK
jgi:hypothetical protein